MVCSTPKMGCEVKFCFSISAITASICSWGAPGRMMIIIMKDSFFIFCFRRWSSSPERTLRKAYRDHHLSKIILVIGGLDTRLRRTRPPEHFLFTPSPALHIHLELLQVRVP